MSPNFATTFALYVLFAVILNVAVPAFKSMLSGVILVFSLYNSILFIFSNSSLFDIVIVTYASVYVVPSTKSAPLVCVIFSAIVTCLYSDTFPFESSAYVPFPVMLITCVSPSVVSIVTFPDPYKLSNSFFNVASKSSPS